MNIKKTSQKPIFDFNTSTNPFAYIRDEKDLYNFIETINRINDATEKEKIDKRVLQLIWIVSSYLLNCCKAVERNVANIIKLFNAISISTNSMRSPFEMIIEECNDSSLKEKFNHFKIQVYGINSDICKTIVEKSINLISSLQLEGVVKELKQTFDTPRQATLHNGKTKHDVWFVPAENFSVKISKNENEKVIIIELPQILMVKEQQEFIEQLFSQPDFCLQKLLEDKAVEIFSLIKKEIKADNEVEKFFKTPEDTDAANHQKTLTDITSELFNEINDHTERDKQIENQLKKVTAIHESGHTVVAYLLKEDYEGVSIEPTKSSLGRMRLVQTPKNENNIIIDYAGMMAEKIWLDNKYYNVSLSGTDAAYATRHAKRFVVEECKNKQIPNLAFIDIDELGLSNADTLYVNFETMKKCIECWHKTESLISANFYLVEALSEELLKRKTISGEEANRFLETISKEKLTQEEHENNNVS